MCEKIRQTSNPERFSNLGDSMTAVHPIQGSVKEQFHSGKEI